MGGWLTAQDSVGEREEFGIVLAGPEIDIAVPVSGCAPHAADLAGNVLEVAGIGARTAVIPAQVVAVEHKNSAFFAGFDQDRRVRLSCIGHHENAAGTLIELLRIERSKRICGSEAAVGEANVEDAFAKLCACGE